MAIVIETTERVAAERRRASAETSLRAHNADLEREVLKRSHVGGRTWELSPEILGVANANGFFESVKRCWSSTMKSPSACSSAMCLERRAIAFSRRKTAHRD